MQLIGYLFHSMRYFAVMIITVGFAGILYSGGLSGIGALLKLIAAGIVMNGAVWLLARWAIRRFRQQRAMPAADTPTLYKGSK